MFCSFKELQALVSEATVTELPSVEELKFSPAEKLKLGAIGFSKLNDAGAVSLSYTGVTYLHAFYTSDILFL